MTDEAAWIAEAGRGDQAAFTHLVEAYQTPVYNLAYRMLGNRDEAEEAAQETFLRAYIHLRSFDPNRPFRSWLFSIASHYCIDRLRRQRMVWVPLEDELMSVERPGRDDPGPEARVVRAEQRVQVQGLLMTLSPTDRAAVTLRYWYDCSYEEIAHTLGLTVSAVKSRLHRARRAMAQAVQEEGER